MEAAETIAGPGDLRVRSRSVAEEVAPHRRLELRAAGKRLAQGAEPSAERAHQLADMLADDEIADPDLAQGAVHVVDEDLGQSHRFRLGTLALRFQAKENQRQHRRDHVETALERVRHSAVAIPGGLAGGGDQRIVEGPERGTLAALAEQSGKQGQGRSPPSGRVLAPFSFCRILEGLGLPARQAPALRLHAGRFYGVFSNMMVSGRKAALLIAAAAGLATGGCTKTQDIQGYLVDETLVSAVQPGVDNKESVQNTLGRPTFTGTFDQNDWYYVSRRTKNFAFNHPRVDQQTILHVRFDPAGNVASVERKGRSRSSRSPR